MKKILFLMLIMFFCISCDKVEEKKYLESILSEYTIYENEKINFNDKISESSEKLIISSDSNIIEVYEGEVRGISKGEAIIVLKIKEECKTVKIIIKEVIDFSVEELELYKDETKELIIEVKKGNKEDILVEKDNDNIEIIDKIKIKGVKVGTTIIYVTLGEVTKEVKVMVKEWEIDILNENFEVDIFKTLELKIKCPEVCKDLITYNIYKEDIIKIEGNIVYPLKEGRTRVMAKIGNGEECAVTFSINVTVNPIEIIKMLHNEEALMKKEITLYGSSNYVQSLLGSVSRYMYGELNLEKNIINIYQNPYVGMTATKEIVEALDRKGYPRSGVKMESIQYLTYHDTGNSAAAADALANSRWMVNQYSVTTSARSWHYTVDENKVIQSIPDDEITWQGDHYDAYTKSIGIETCVNAGANMNVIWHRMGKLCALLMNKYGLEIKDIKQHYDWNQKNCPQTLRRNGLYSYAISLIEGELLVRKYLIDYQLSFESLNPEYLDNTGQIIKIPNDDVIVGYKVTVTNKKGYNESITLYTNVKAI